MRRTLGYCTITNVQQRNAATLRTSNQDEPLVGHHDGEGNEMWMIDGLSNGRFCISSSIHEGQFACATNPEEGTVVQGWNKEQEWKVRKAPIPGAFLITTVDDHWYWSLPYPDAGTPIELSRDHHNKQCWWYVDWIGISEAGSAQHQFHGSSVESRKRYELEAQWQELIAWTTSRREEFHETSLPNRRNSGDGHWQHEQYDNFRPEPTVGVHREATRANMEDRLRQLVNYDTVIIVDDSGSMAGGRWREARDALKEVATLAARYDTDGIDLCFLNSDVRGRCLSADRVQLLFDGVAPYGRTPTGETLEKLLNEYLLKLEQAQLESPRALQQIKPVNFLVITDGEPTDDPESVIVSAARRLDWGRFPIHQLGIQFVQIGNDREATEALKRLDDDLTRKHNIRDIVDTTLYSGHRLDANTVTKCLLGGIDRRIDNITRRATH